MRESLDTGTAEMHRACVPPERLSALAEGGPPTDVERAHLTACVACETALRRARDDAQLALELVQAVGAVAKQRTPPAPSIEGFEIRAEIHRGGQGVVYEAWQTSTKRPVAIKVPSVSGSLTTRQLARFEREIELAASITHPAVVAVYASGLTSDGRPYIAMELVSGFALDEHAASLDRDPKSLRKLLHLFAELCRGVDAAHQRGIIHRDLKPANIVVDAAGKPRILDFGIARLNEAQHGQTVTREGDFVGTLAYAAPEQLSTHPDQVDIRTDVYALGVIAYELVTGQRPHMYVESVAGLVKAITELPVPIPRIKDKPADRELRTVLLTALSKEPSRRYASAAALAEDVERYLQGRPLRARGDGIWYPARMAMKRHPYATAASAVAALLGIAGGTIVVQSDVRARRADATKSATVDAILEALAQADPDSEVLRKRVDGVVGFLDQAVEITRERLADHPHEQTNLFVKLAKAYANRGELADAQRLLEEAVATSRRARPSAHVDIAMTRMELGEVLRKRDDRQGAKRELTAATADLRARLGDRHRDTLRCMHRLAELHIRDREYEAAKSLMERVIAERDRQLRTDDLLLCESRIALASALRGLCDYEAALARCLQARATLSQREHGSQSKEMAATLEHIVANLISLRREAEAEPLAIEAVRIRGNWYQPDSAQYAAGLVQLASVRRRLGGEGTTQEQRQHLVEARDLSKQVLDIRLKVYGEKDHELVAEARSLVGRILVRLGELEEAEQYLRPALEMRQRLRSGADQRNIARSEAYLGDCLASGGQFAIAEPLLRHAVEVLRAATGCQNDGEHADAARRLASLLEATGRSAEAAELRATTTAR